MLPPAPLSRWKNPTTHEEFIVTAAAVLDGTDEPAVVYRRVPIPTHGGAVLRVCPLADFLARLHLVADPHPLPQPTLAEAVRAESRPPAPPPPKAANARDVEFVVFMAKLSTRVRNILENEGIGSFEDLMKAEHPLEWRLFGETCMAELKTHMRRAGYHPPKGW